MWHANDSSLGFGLVAYLRGGHQPGRSMRRLGPRALLHLQVGYSGHAARSCSACRGPAGYNRETRVPVVAMPQPTRPGDNVQFFPMDRPEMISTPTPRASGEGWLEAKKTSPFWAMWRSYLTYAFVLVLFVSLSMGQHVSSGPWTVQVSEPFAGVTIAGIWALGSPSTDGRTLRGGARRLLALGFWVMAAWCVILWLIGENWQARSGLVWPWIICALLVTILPSKLQADWNSIAFLFVLGAIPLTAMAFAQHFAGVGYGHKSLLGWVTGTSTVPVTGFMGFPNDMAGYLLWPLVVSVGLVFSGSKLRRTISTLCVVLLGAALFWTYSRGALLSVLVAVVLFTVLLSLRHRRDALIALLVAGMAAGIAAALVLARYPIAQLTSGRPLLWAKTLGIIGSDRLWLLFGYLSVIPPDLQVWWYPHNIYLLSWMQFGLLGFLFLAAIVGYLVRLGWVSFDALRKGKAAAALWSGTLGFFLVEGMVANDLLEPYSLLTFACALMILAGLIDQARLEQRSS